MDRINQDVSFINHLFFSDVSTFCFKRYVNRHDCRYWSSRNPKWVEQIYKKLMFGVVFGAILSSRLSLLINAICKISAISAITGCWLFPDLNKYSKTAKIGLSQRSARSPDLTPIDFCLWGT